MIAIVIAYIAAIPAANWLIGNVGTVCMPQGPCLVPVLPGILAPSGVLMIGVALLLRDLVQRHYGAKLSLSFIVAGTAVSFLIAPPSLAIASGLAFALSELADFAVFTPLYQRRLVAALVLSCIAGAVVDSAIFLWLAFGSVDHIEGQIIGKIYAVLLFVAIRYLRCRMFGHHRIGDMTYGGYGWICSRCGKNDFGIHDM